MTNEEVITLMKDKLSNAAISREYSSDPIAANLCDKEVEAYTLALDALEIRFRRNRYIRTQILLLMDYTHRNAECVRFAENG